MLTHDFYFVWPTVSFPFEIVIDPKTDIENGDAQLLCFAEETLQPCPLTYLKVLRMRSSAKDSNGKCLIYAKQCEKLPHTETRCTVFESWESPPKWNRQSSLWPVPSWWVVTPQKRLCLSAPKAGQGQFHTLTRLLRVTAWINFTAHGPQKGCRHPQHPRQQSLWSFFPLFRLPQLSFSISQLN